MDLATAWQGKGAQQATEGATRRHVSPPRNGIREGTKNEIEGPECGPVFGTKSVPDLGRIFSFPFQLRIEGPEYGPVLGTKMVPVLGPQIGYKGVDFGIAAAHVHG